MTAITAGGGTTVPHTWWHWETSEIGHRSMATVCCSTSMWVAGTALTLSLYSSILVTGRMAAVTHNVDHFNIIRISSHHTERLCVYSCIKFPRYPKFSTNAWWSSNNFVKYCEKRLHVTYCDFRFSQQWEWGRLSSRLLRLVVSQKLTFRRCLLLP